VRQKRRRPAASQYPRAKATIAIFQFYIQVQPFSGQQRGATPAAGTASLRDAAQENRNEKNFTRGGDRPAPAARRRL
jgi:hypothetical protein